MKRRITVLAALALGAFVLTLAAACSDNDAELRDYWRDLGPILSKINVAAIPVASAFVDSFRCTAGDECAEADRRLSTELRINNLVLDDQLSNLDAMKVPAEMTRLHLLYTDELVIRRDAGETIIQSLESGDAELFNAGLLEYQEGTAKLGEILDEFQRLFAGVS